MSRRWLGDLTLIVAASAVGWIGWSGVVLLLPLSALLPALWSIARSRARAALVSAAYFLSASRALPQGVATFYASDLFPGFLLWLVASSAFVVVHALAWTGKGDWWRAVRYLGASCLMAIPPFGILGWAHPVTSAGVLFPGWGWSGLVVMAAGLSLMTTWLRSAAAMALTGLWLWSAAEWTAPSLPPGWHGVDLDLGASLGRNDSLGRHRDLAATVRAAKRDDSKVVVLPESAFGFWTPTVERHWKHELKGTGLAVLAGAAVVNDNGYDNVLVSISEKGSDVAYRERMPVPGSMWQPWRALTGGSGGAVAHFFGEPTAMVGDIRIAPLICYEALLVWPILQSMLGDPDALVAVGNGWWTSGTSIIDIQRATAQAWARLFDKPLVISFNM